MTWRTARLGQGLRVKHGFAFKGEFFAKEGELIVVTPGNFLEKGGFRVRQGKERFYTSDFPETYLLEKDDLIVAMTEQGEGLLGSAARIPADKAYLHNQRIGLVQVTDESLFNKQYLYWLFNWRTVREQIRGSATGTKVKHTAPERIYKVEISLPTLNEQVRIAELLDGYDDLIEINRRRIALLEESARLLYREWFVDLRFPGHTSEMKRDGFPASWQQKKLIEIATVNQSSLGAKTKLETIQYLDIASVETGVILGATPMAFCDAPGRARRLVQHGDVIWSCVRPNRKSYAFIWNPDDDLVVSTGFAVLTANLVPFTYLYFATTSDTFVSYLTNRATGAAYPAVSGRDFEEADIWCPPDTLLREFHSRCLPMLDLKNNLLLQNAQLISARDELLPRLMSGQIKV